MRLSVELAQFQLEIKYRSGKYNVNADALSRKVKHDPEPHSVPFEEVHWTVKMFGIHLGTKVPIV